MTETLEIENSIGNTLIKYDIDIKNKNINIEESLYNALLDYAKTPHGQGFMLRNQIIYNLPDFSLDANMAMKILNDRVPQEILNKYEINSITKHNPETKIKKPEIKFVEDNIFLKESDLMKSYKNDCQKTGENNGYNKESLQNMLSQTFDIHQMEEIQSGINNGLTQEQVEFYAKPEFGASQMSLIKDGFRDGFSPEQMAFYAKPEFDSKQMLTIICGLRKGFSEEQLALYANPEFSYQQMLQIYAGLRDDLSLEQVQEYAKPEYDWTIMKAFREDIEKEDKKKSPTQDFVAHTKVSSDKNQSEPSVDDEER